MNSKIFVAAIAIAASAQVACAQFGSGIVFDPTQSGHAIQQITQGNQLYTTTVQTTRNVIAAYNLAQRMASLPQNAVHVLQQSRSAAMDRAHAACKHLWQFTALDECRYDRIWSVCRKSDLQSSAHRADIWIFQPEHAGPTGDRSTGSNG